MDGNASTPWWNVFDGTGNIIFRDLDGSLTLNKDTAVVDNRPFFNGPRCSIRPDWGLAICPYKYVQMVIRGKTGVLHKKFRGKTPVLINRDDKPEDVYVQTGATGHKYNLRVLRSYTVKFNSTLGPPPRDIQFRPKFGLENNEMIRIAVCLPKSTNKFTIYSTYPQLHPKRKLFPKMVNSLKDLNRDTTMKAFFWDKEEGYLYFKMRSPYSLTRPGQVCPGDVCLDVNIIRADGGNEPAVCDTLVTPYFFRDRSRKIRNRDCEPATSQGLGAPIETGFEPPPPSDENCN
ncbi:transmembrane protein 2-like [Plakobranchus ocellatus]|uniref:Transmembrane protein 2-like n=1 Tax=Plakobranchus ocellatus TaxID=259542 RepID=A0AAV4DMR0_9GAST|nr:transmembrane protein 2-like [Plakobranchus ocellatus]